jgi:membrane-bound serine protease (ClpP class)
LSSQPSEIHAADPPAPVVAGPVGQFITISGALDDAEFGRISRMALALQSRAVQESRRGVIVVQIEQGASATHHVENLARFLANDLKSVQTVAWIPKSVRGTHAILALACQEIVMHPEAELGDIGLGKAIGLDEQSFVLRMVQGRHNARVNEALASGMMDPAVELVLVQTQAEAGGAAVREDRVVTADEFQRLLDAKAVIVDRKELKPRGAFGAFSGARARAGNFLVSSTAMSRAEVAERYRLPAEATRETGINAETPRPILIRVVGTVDRLTQQFSKRRVQQAINSGVNLIIIEVDCDGGEIAAAAELANAIADASTPRVRTAAWVPKQAIGPSALIALACDDLYVSREARIGAIAKPVAVADAAAGVDPNRNADVLSPVARDLAERKGRSSGLLEAMCRGDMKVFEVTNKESGSRRYMSDTEWANAGEAWARGQVVPETAQGGPLLLTGARAHELGVAAPPVADVEELKQRLGVPPNSAIPSLEPTWVDGLVIWLNHPSTSVILIMLAFLLLYFEAHFPCGAFGIGAVLCVAIFFWSRFLGGTAGWLEVILFVIGLALLAVEILVLPGFGVFGISGILLILASLIMATQTFVVPATPEDMSNLARTIGQFGGAVIGLLVIIAALSRLMPEMPFMKEMILAPPGSSDVASGQPRLKTDTLLNAETLGLLGRKGVAETLLRPAGKARIGDSLVDVVSEGAFVQPGTSIKVVAVDGTSIVVRPMS